MFLAFLLTLANVESVRAQQDEQMSLYMYNPLYFNPAYAGSRGTLSAVGLARLQWTSFEGAPKSQWVSVHSPLLFKSLGIGGHMVNDQIGARKRTAAYLDFSAGIKLNNQNSRLAAGMSVGFDALSYDFSNAQVNDPADPYFGQQFSTTKPNVGAGLYYYNDRYFVGLSSPRILEIRGDNVSAIIETLNKRHFFLSAGYVFDLNSVLKLKPATLMKYTPNAPVSIDLNVNLLMYDRVWAGLMYRFHESIGVNTVIKIKEALSVGYVYDFPINGLQTFQGGSHEFLLQFDLTKKNTVFTSPRYF